MKLIKLTIFNHLTGWNFKDLCFDYLTLLVGASGVGKTQILRTIKDVASIARGISINGLEWNVIFEIDTIEYRWCGEFAKILEDDISIIEGEKKNYSIVWESLYRGGVLVVNRGDEQIFLNREKTVKLDPTKSAISLLKEVDTIKPVYEAFAQISELKNDDDGIHVSPFFSKNSDNLKDINDVRNNRMLDPIEKLFLLRKNGFEEFETIKQLFIEVFPLVEDIDFSLETVFNGLLCPILKIKERGVDTWIMQNKMSSGMIRTLVQITFLILAQDGDIVLIDEFENGLGVNCIDKLADQIQNPDQDIQVIMTSHHPYIINGIPFNRWKVITRERSSLKILTAEDLRIGKHSKHEAFMQLIQTDAFRTGKS